VEGLKYNIARGVVSQAKFCRRCVLGRDDFGEIYCAIDSVSSIPNYIEHENPQIEHAIPRQHTSRHISHLFGLQGDQDTT
jgi:hypothetical protein